MKKQDIIDYVTKTPLNTNKAILEEMLDDLIKVAVDEEGGEIIPPPVPPILPPAGQTTILDGGVIE